MCLKLVVLHESLQNLHSLVVALLLKELTDLQNLVFDVFVGLIEHNAGLHHLQLSLEQIERVRIRNLHARADFDG